MKATPCIWIIDDDRNDIELMESVISSHMPGVEIRSFIGGDPAQALLDEMAAGRDDKTMLPGLILLDLKMPVRDGFDMFGYLRSNEMTAVKPVVIFSSSRMDKDIRKSYKLGVNAFVTKPVNFNDFEKVLRTLLDFWFLTCEVAEDHQTE